MMSPDKAIFGGSLGKKIRANKHPSERVLSACPLDLFLLSCRSGLLYLPVHTQTCPKKLQRFQFVFKVGKTVHFWLRPGSRISTKTRQINANFNWSKWWLKMLQEPGTGGFLDALASLDFTLVSKSVSESVSLSFKFETDFKC